MNASATALPGWSRRRFWSVALILFAAQAGLLLLFGSDGRRLLRKAPMPGHFLVMDAPLSSDQLTKRFFAVDPMVFAWPNGNNFAEEIWLNAPEPQLEMPSAIQSAESLGLDPSRLAFNLPRQKRAEITLPPRSAESGDTEIEPWPATLAPESIRAQSLMDIHGGLSARCLNLPAQLPSWPSAQLLSNSVVEIAVNPAGQVIAARLLGRSGLIDADTNALDHARNLRFTPSRFSSPVWGRVVFQWQTLEPTNGAPPAAPAKP